ncbi:helix-turn-helix domain-containing protein [Roseibium sp. RKSG952]|uniref:MarR family transcriptional regulator n=1 Tax=Roseibium sp. RKSG952 TaxID=2529384 RepID=UPI0012BC5AB9|nr:helix-turn-helix domain-containing protein [Roseibium sp. RKSG952]MTH96554.1 MarR family transcriptional regulator [Roseibium sp. RKSG952]
MAVVKALARKDFAFFLEVNFFQVLPCYFRNGNFVKMTNLRKCEHILFIQLMDSSDSQKDITAKLANLSFGNIDAIKRYLGLDSYDSVVVVLVVAAGSREEAGISEAEVARRTEFTRSKANRLLKRLSDTGHLDVISDSYPRRFRYNFHYAEAAYEDASEAERQRLTKAVVDNSIEAMITLYQVWAVAHFDKVP